MTGKVVLNTTFTSTLSWQLYSHCGVTWDVTWTSYVKSHTATRVICEVNKFNWVKRLSYSWTTFTTSAFKIWEKSRSHFSKICQYFCWKNWYLMSNVGVTKINPHIEENFSVSEKRIREKEQTDISENIKNNFAKRRLIPPVTGKVVLNTTFTSTLSWQLYSHCGVTWDVTWTSYVKSHTATRVICEVNKFNWVKRLSYSWTTFTTSAFKIWEKSRSHFSKICQYFCWKNWYLMSNVGVTKINPHIEENFSVSEKRIPLSVASCSTTTNLTK